MKKILIIGGMGPQAGITLHQKIINQAVKNGVKIGSEFPAITHVSIPVPEFIDSPKQMRAAFRVIKESLYCLWRSGLYTYCHSMQYGSSTY